MLLIGSLSLHVTFSDEINFPSFYLIRLHLSSAGRFDATAFQMDVKRKKMFF